MLGRVAYGQTQYAQSGQAASKTETFQEFLSLVESRSFLTRKSFTGLIGVLDNVETLASKGFAEYLLLTDPIKKNIVQVWQETLSLADNIGRRVLITFQDILSLSEGSSTVWTKTKSLVENIIVSFSGNFSLTKILSEALTLTEDYLAGLRGIIFKEYLEVHDVVVKTISKTLQEVVGVVDSIKKYLNGFFIRWVKRPTTTTSWTKKDLPDTEWETQEIRRVED